MDSLIGTLFAGRFQLDALLGEGGMGAVYLARHAMLNRQVAVKVIRKNLITDRRIVARFRREARAASRAVHPNITSVFDFGNTDEGQPYLVMEYVEGCTLAEVIAREKSLPLARALRLLGQIAEALAAAHACQVVHRDLKPQNIILTTRLGQPDFVKILDFGLAKIIGVTTTGNLSAQGAFGTPEYMSPEQCSGGTSDHRTDIYSFGVLMFEMLVGQVPFRGPMVQVMRAQMEKEPQAPSAGSSRKDLSSSVDKLVLRCLAKKPEHRYPDATTLGKDLLALRQASGNMPLLVEEPVCTAQEQIPSSVVSLLDTLPPLPALPDPGWTEGESEVWEPTVADSFPAGERFAEAARSVRLEELACAIRDRGLGSAEISQVLALRIRAEDLVFDLESRIAALNGHRIEVEVRARGREARLRRALVQLEQERARLLPGLEAHDSSKTLPWGSKVPSEGSGLTLAQLEENALSISKTIREISVQAERELSALQEQERQLQCSLEGRRGEAARLSEHLAHVLRQTRSQIEEPADAELLQLFELAGIG